MRVDSGTAVPAQPNIVFILLDDLRWDALSCMLGPDREPHARRMVTFPLLLQRAGYETAFIGKWHLGNDLTPAPGIDETIDFIKRPHAKPFLVYLSHKAVHAPFIPAERHKNLFADTPITRALSAKDDWEGKPVLRRPGVTLRANDSDVTTSDDNIRDQLRCLLAVDESVKRIMETLAATCQLDRTIIVFTSDHGYFWGEHGLGGKHGPYEEAMRIPLFVRYPPLIKAGTVIDQIALSIDLAPTLLEMGKAPPDAGMQGRSLVSLLQGQTENARSSFLAEFFLGNGTARFPTWQAVRTTRWKFIRYPEFAGMEELYDLKADPHEMRNLIREPQAQATKGELQTELEHLLEETK